MKILALMKYDDLAASTRQRLLQYQRYFLAAGIEVSCVPLLSNEYLNDAFRGRKLRVSLVIKNYFKRLSVISTGESFDAIWVHCESFPYLFGFMERLVFLRGKPVIYDFDDAIFHQYDLNRNWIIRTFLAKKLQPLLRGSALAICGNRYLQDYAAQYCKWTEVVPTVVDTNVFIPKASEVISEHLTIGWIGSPSTWQYVLPLIETLSQLGQEFDVCIRIVGAGQNAKSIPHFEFVDWTQESEVEEIQNMDIGIMPLPIEPWARGKCGYKLIQYMACGVAVVASPVGVNSVIVEDGVNGVLATTLAEWEAALRKLLLDHALRTQMGNRGRHKIEAEYSLHVHGPRLVEFVRQAVLK
jgi:glycosyltransferase involved in cell wall biosynthesis